MTEPLGIASIAGTLNSHGHICDLIFLNEERDFLEYIRQTKPDLLGFSLITGDTNRKLKIMQVVKENYDIPIIVGGPHTTLYFEELLSNKFIDLCCIGDGELSLLELLNKFDVKDTDYNIKNIYFKRNGKIIKNSLFLTDVETLQNPDRGIFFKYDFLRKTPLKRFITSYGCPYTCNFCWNKDYLSKFKGQGTYYRRKTCDKIIGEIKEVLDMAPKTKRIHFHDDIFNLPNSWLEEFCEKYDTALSGFPWSCTVRVDLLNEQLIKKMQKSGCVGVTIGVETANEEKRMKFLGKKILNKEYEEKCALLNKYNIKILSSNMTNLPFEGIEDIINTLEFNKRLQVYGMRTAILTVWKGQETYNHCIRNAIKLIPMENSETSYIIANKSLLQIRKLNCLFNFLYKFGLVKFWRFFIYLPLPLWCFRVFRLYDGYLEMKFFNVEFVKGIKYYLKISKEFKSYQKVR